MSWAFDANSSREVPPWRGWNGMGMSFKVPSKTNQSGIPGFYGAKWFKQEHLQRKQNSLVCVASSAAW